MTKRIIQLSKDLINKIAAGEVIERSASVVKELLENSIDANATKVEIAISNNCRNIRVADNGSGIHPDDIIIAFNKHSTSKISNYEDLWTLNSFGFRGEALSSILSISNLKCTTRIKENDFAVLVEFDSNGEMKTSHVASSVGTIFDVKNLFHNVPVRLKFLKNPKTEFAYIQEVVTQIALANPNVGIVLKNNGKEIFKTSSSDFLLSTINEIFSSNLQDKLLEVNNSDIFNNFYLKGYISAPTLEKSSKKSMYFYVNKRPVKCSVFSKAIDMVYKTRMAKGKYPMVVLNLSVDPAFIDVNIHPQKKEIKYSDANKVFSFLFNSLNKVLENANYLQQDEIALNLNYRFKNANAFNSKFSQEEDDIVISEHEISNDTQISLYSLQNNSEKKDANKDFSQYNYQNSYETKTIAQDHNKPKELSFKVIGQFLDTYIIFEESNNLYIIDQHIADERVIYNNLKANRESASQIILISDLFDLNEKDWAFFEENREFFKKYGYEYILKEPNKFMFRKIPQVLNHIKLKDILSEMLQMQYESASDLEEKILISTSCKGAIKAHQALMTWQMYNLIEKWKETSDNTVCPHGRPIVKKLDQNEIASWFHRKSET